MQWYYVAGGEQAGPVTEEDFQALVRAGTITAATMVWKAGMADWAAYGTLATAAPATPATAQPAAAGVCCECGQSFAADELLSYEGSRVCGGCKPLFFQRIQEGAAIPGMRRYAGFWIRAAAKLLDGVLVGIVVAVISFAIMAASGLALAQRAPALATQLVTQLLSVLIQGGYYIFFHGRYGATPGKMACKIKVIRADGSPITFGRMTGRFFADLLSRMILGIGYIMAGSDDEKRALHDRMCDTRVVYKD